MSSIVKRPNGRWQATYKGPDRHERSRTFDRKVDADNWLKTQGADLARGQWADPRLGKVTFGEWATKWQATTVHLRPTTRARDLSYLKTHVLPRFERAPLAAITHIDVRSWVADLVAAGKAPATVAKAFQIGGKVMRSAVEAGMIPSSPFTNVKTPKIEREERPFLSPVEVAHLADAIDQRYRALVLVGAYGGLRIGELAGLRRSRVDLTRGTIDVAEIVVEVSGNLTFGPPKTRAGRRSVSLPRPVVDELATHLARTHDEFVFPAPLGGPLRVPAFRHRRPGGRHAPRPSPRGGRHLDRRGGDRARDRGPGRTHLGGHGVRPLRPPPRRSRRPSVRPPQRHVRRPGRCSNRADFGAAPGARLILPRNFGGTLGESEQRPDTKPQVKGVGVTGLEPVTSAV
jgi:integrase